MTPPIAACLPLGLLTGALALAMTAAAASARGEAAAVPLRVDCARAAGTIRPLHGINNGPLDRGGIVDLSAWHRQLGGPLTRLHDVHWPDADAVDFHTIFPDLGADPARPESYRFAATDEYLQAIVDVGMPIVYRLGESIEHRKHKRYVHPPADYAKWTAACLGIIRHYNEGWAGGFRHGIRYWEIWNEAENRPAMWSGSDDDYFRLYAAAARAIKAEFPDLKVGGPAVGDSGRMEGGQWRATPFMTGFLDACKRLEAPLDFFSWHIYTDDPAAPAFRARAIRQWLDANGFGKTELHLNEWNYLPGNDWGPLSLAGQGKARKAYFEAIGGPPGAAFTACTLIGLLDSPLDAANYYSGDTLEFGLFDRYGGPRKPFYVMKAFRTLLDTPHRVEAAGGEPGRLALAAGVNADKTAATVLVANYRSDRKRVDLAVANLPWAGPAACEVFILDASRDLEKCEAFAAPGGELHVALDLPAPSVGLVTIRKAQAGP